MSRTIDRDKLVEWLEEMRVTDTKIADSLVMRVHSETKHRAYAYAAQATIEKIQSGAFGIPNNHLQIALSNIAAMIVPNSLTEDHVANRMKRVAVEALNISVTEPSRPCEECAGWGEVIYDDTFGMSQTTSCRKCEGTGRLTEPSVDRVRELPLTDETESIGGWVISPDYLQEIAGKIEDFEYVSMEGIEAVLLAHYGIPLVREGGNEG